MIYSCPKAGYLLCDFPLSQRECKFLFNYAHLRSASSSPCIGTRSRLSEANRAGVHYKPLLYDVSETFLHNNKWETCHSNAIYITLDTETKM